MARATQSREQAPKKATRTAPQKAGSPFTKKPNKTAPTTAPTEPEVAGDPIGGFTQHFAGEPTNDQPDGEPRSNTIRLEDHVRKKHIHSPQKG
jgi:hypothetical protein